MELKKHPETEREYWEAIESLGGYIFSTNHGLLRGHIEDPKGKVVKSIEEAKALQQQLAREISEKFGVILYQDYPKFEAGKTLPPAPAGKIYYREWYDKMKREAYSQDYEGLICSACPFSEGLDQMISMGGSIPCGVWSGTINRLRAPHLCAKVTSSDWTDETLEKEIVRKGGSKALTQFRKKKRELLAKFEQSCAAK